MGGNVASWKAVKISRQLTTQERRRMVREKPGEVGRDKPMQCLVSHG